jgi:hypothetical protein
MIGMRVDVETGKTSVPVGLTISSSVNVRNPERSANSGTLPIAGVLKVN